MSVALFVHLFPPDDCLEVHLGKSVSRQTSAPASIREGLDGTVSRLHIRLQVRSL